MKKIVVKDKTSRKTVSKTVDLVVDGDNKETYIDYDIDTWIVGVRSTEQSVGIILTKSTRTRI